MDETGGWYTKRSGSLQVGDIVKVKTGQSAPADLVVLYSKQIDGKCGIKTDQIDGETDTKIRKAVDQTQQYFQQEKMLKELSFEMVVDIPNEFIYSFKGAFHLLDKEEQYILKASPVDIENSMWAQSTLSKGEIYGLVIYSGDDSKLMMGKVESSPKRSLVDDELNTISKTLFVIMFFAGLLLITIKGFGYNWFIQFFRYILLLCSIIPISMKVNQDISKLFYASRIGSDSEIPGTISRNSMIAEDLGRIQYFLTDKTGTLTQNVMIMKRCGLGANEIRADDLEDSKALAIRACQTQKYQLCYEGDDFHSKALSFFVCVMTCHSVDPNMSADGVRTLESSSPDEIAFIEYCEHLGYKLLFKSDSLVEFSDPEGLKYSFNIKNVFPFTSSRKRMGLIVEYNNRIVYMLKGADSTMVPFLKESSREGALQNTLTYSKEGLRTLVLAETMISETDYNNWKENYHKAQTSMEDRGKKVEAAINLLERDMNFVGVTAVEDLLQVNVKQSIELLRHAGIKVWMLTGDKLETAKSISITTGLYDVDQDELFVLKDVTSSEDMKEELDGLLNNLMNRKSTVRESARGGVDLNDEIQFVSPYSNSESLPID